MARNARYSEQLKNVEAIWRDTTLSEFRNFHADTFAHISDKLVVMESLFKS